MTLAIVDDDEDVRRAIARLLSSLGHDVRVFSSAEEFEAASVSVDCAIVDVRMPGVNGIELCERLRSRVTPTPVLLITGDTDPFPQEAVRPLDPPALNKPFDEVTLMAAIEVTVASAARLRENRAR